MKLECPHIPPECGDLFNMSLFLFCSDRHKCDVAGVPFFRLINWVVLVVMYISCLSKNFEPASPQYALILIKHVHFVVPQLTTSAPLL